MYFQLYFPRLMIMGIAGHWRVLEEMGGWFSTVNVMDDQHVVDEGDLITSAGISPGSDMALKVVTRHHGDAVARATARYMEYPFPEDNPRAGLIVWSRRSSPLHVSNKLRGHHSSNAWGTSL